MVKHLFYAAWNTSPCRTSARQGGERSGPCRDVRVTELCEVKGDVTIPELKRQQHGHTPPPIYRPAYRRRLWGQNNAEDFKEGDSVAIAAVMCKQRDGGSANHLQRQNERKKRHIRVRRFAGETSHENGLGSKENESPRKRYSIVQCNRYTILNVQIWIIPDSSSNRL